MIDEHASYVVKIERILCSGKVKILIKGLKFEEINTRTSQREFDNYYM